MHLLKKLSDKEIKTLDHHRNSNYSEFFEENKKKLNKVWQGIKEIINVNKKLPKKHKTSTITENL